MARVMRFRGNLRNRDTDPILTFNAQEKFIRMTGYRGARTSDGRFVAGDRSEQSRAVLHRRSYIPSRRSVNLNVPTGRCSQHAPPLCM
jgi:hypothetical protein